MRSSEIIERAKSRPGSFVAVKFSEEAKATLEALQRDYAVPNPIHSEEFHVTLVYSREPISWKAAKDLDEVATPIGWEMFHQRDGKDCLVLLVESDYLQERFALSQEMGATYDYPEYKPHVTLSYDVPKDFDYSNIPLPGPLVFEREYARTLRDASN